MNRLINIKLKQLKNNNNNYITSRFYVFSNIIEKNSPDNYLKLKSTFNNKKYYI